MENEIYEVEQENAENAVEVYTESETSGKGSKIGAVIGGAALVAGVVGIIAIAKKRKAKKKAHAVEDAIKVLEENGYDVNIITSTFEDKTDVECDVVDAE